MNPVRSPAYRQAGAIGSVKYQKTYPMNSRSYNLNQQIRLDRDLFLTG